MLNIGWSEMLIVAAIALIVVGPKDLPAMLRQMGRVFGTVRRMGNEFKSEISKVAALDEIKDIKSSITKPLEDTHKELTNQFNTVGKDGVEPSGAIKPAVEGQESVANEIRESAGLKSTPAKEPSAAALSMKASIDRTKAQAAAKAEAAEAAAKAEAEKAAPVKKPATRKRASTKTVAKTKTTASKANTAKEAPVKRAATKKTAAKPTTRNTVAATTAKNTAKPKRAPAKRAAAPKGDA